MNQKRFFITIALGAIVASVAYPIIIFLLSMQVDGYSHIRDHISELGVSNIQYSWILTAVLILDATLIFGLAFAVQRSIGQRDHNRWAPILIGMFGVALLIGGLFPCDANCRPTSFNGWMHVLNILPSIVATIGAPFVMQKKFAEDQRLSLSSTVSFILGVLTVVFIFFSMTLFPMLNLEGLGQRFVLVLQLSFYVLTASSVIHVNLGQHNRRVVMSAAASSVQ